MSFQYNYNLTGSNRKPLVEAVSQILDQPAVYQGAPSFSYTVGDYTVDKEGVLSYGSNIHPDFAATLIENLRKRGFAAERVAMDNAAEKTNSEETATDSNVPDTVPNDDVSDNFTVEIPDTGFTPEAKANLKKIVASKATLLEQALGTDNLLIVELDGKIAFPWFTLHGLDGEVDAYSRLIAAICTMAKTQKRVTVVEKPVDNAKFTMRLFLIRLGFIGDEYKTARKILLRNLSGNSSWKSGHRPKHNVDAAIPPNPSEAALTTVQELTSPLEKTDADSCLGIMYGEDQIRRL